ncbi:MULTISPECIES: hypothetical protein [Lentzea]|uniref:PilZ domain-containing protein n=1 Tax=Lentzea sokolovensis TaxID=3095429 RepID=A0ABU4UM58_9PSEU|nr:MULTISPECIES: hypothetical protein [Lentzea]MDX8140576.1 hypothetical protein [Lentzea sp. BCCO 10_0061]
MLNHDDVEAFGAAETVLLKRQGRRFYLSLALELDLRSVARGVTAREEELFNLRLSEQGQRVRVIAAVGEMFGTEHGSLASWSLIDHPDATGHLALSCAQSDSRWKTVAQIVRPGDGIGLRFIGNTQPHLLLSRGQVRDEVEFEIRRRTKTFTFLLGVTVGPPDIAQTVRHEA